MAENARKAEKMQNTITNRRSKFVRYDEGAVMYSMCKNTFMKLAHDAQAIYKVNRMVLVNTELLDEYLESFRLEQ